MKKFKAGWLVACSMLLVIAGSCERDKQLDSLTDEQFRVKLNQRITEWMESYDVPSVTLAVISKGEISWTNAYGIADVSHQVRMTPETVCRVESISKSVTARGVMKLAEKGNIKLDDPVFRHLHSWEFPESDVDIEKVTIRHLLSHSSGLQLGTIGLEYAPGQKKPSLREALSREVQFVQEPGKSFIYSNVGFNLLELLIEDVSGQSFSEFMKEEILLPSGMQNASFEWNVDFTTSVPDGYTVNGDPVPVYVYSEKGAGGLFANVEDIARFVASGMLNEFYSENYTLSQNSIRELYTPVMDVAGIYSFVAGQYGLGHFIETLPDGQRAVFGGGQGHGWMTHFHLIPDAGDGIVILTNSSTSWPLISNILSDWAEWNGFGSVGMGIISKTITAVWILVLLLMSALLLQFLKVLHDYLKKKRQLDVQFKNYSALQIAQLSLFLILASVIIWCMTRDYLMITSVFPGVTGWLMFTIALASMTSLIMALMPNNGEKNHRHEVIDM